MSRQPKEIIMNKYTHKPYSRATGKNYAHQATGFTSFVVRERADYSPSARPEKRRAHAIAMKHLKQAAKQTARYRKAK